jgi:cold-inducible RNA-binding protein
MSSRLFVGNLSYDATEDEVRDHFAQAGPVSRVFIPLDRDTGRPRGFAFVEFSDPEVAKSALERFNQQPFKDRPLVVNEARPSEARPAGPPRRPPSSDGRPPAPRSSGLRERTTAIPGGLETGGEAPARRAAPAKPRRRGGKKAFWDDRPQNEPIRERRTGRISGEDDDGEEGEDDMDFENFATSESDSEDE